MTRFMYAQILLHLKRAWRDGTTAVVFEPEDFLSKLTALIPQPRVNTIRFHGVFAARARIREQVVPEPDELPKARGCSGSGDTRPDQAYRLGWADLLKRVFAFDVLLCPRCESRMTQIAWILDRSSISKILTAVGVPADSPTFAPGKTNHDEFDTAPIH